MSEDALISADDVLRLHSIPTKNSRPLLNWTVGIMLAWVVTIGLHVWITQSTGSTPEEWGRRVAIAIGLVEPSDPKMDAAPGMPELGMGLDALKGIPDEPDPFDWNRLRHPLRGGP